MKNSADKVEPQSYDDLFGEVSSHYEDQVVSVKLSQLYDFKNHPFKVMDDEEMLELAQSVSERGVLVPAMVRPRKGGGYEVLAGHRRKHASFFAGKAEMPIICRNLSDDDATLLMIDSNIQRESLLPSEKAFAYRMKTETLKHQGKKGKSTAKDVGEKAGDNERTVQRYIRLTYLTPELLELVDNKKIALIAGADLSFLNSEEQGWLLECINANGKYPDGTAVGQLKEYSKRGELTSAVIDSVLQGKKSGSLKVVIKDERIKEYFPDHYDKQQIEKVIFFLLEQWKVENSNK
jgi:ParB family chromosome partitioning protein